MLNATSDAVTTLEERPGAPVGTAPGDSGPGPDRARPGPTVPRGWYADPAGCHQFRFWDGRRWTPGVADNGFVREDPLPEQPCADPARDERARPPLRAAGVGVAGLVLGALAALAIGLALHEWAPTHKAVALALSEVALWIGMMGAVVLVSRRYGSGSVRHDFGLHVRWVDAAWGLLLAIVARAATAAIVVVVLLAAGRPHDGSSRSGLGAAHLDINRLVVLCVLLVIGAPLIEEIFFRGLLLRSFQTRMPIAVAVGLQALLFSACHALTATGIGLVAELLSTLLFGLLAGAVVTRFRRLGPTIVAHSLFNLVAAAVLVAAAT